MTAIVLIPDSELSDGGDGGDVYGPGGVEDGGR